MLVAQVLPASVESKGEVAEDMTKITIPSPEEAIPFQTLLVGALLCVHTTAKAFSKTRRIAKINPSSTSFVIFIFPIFPV